MEKPLTLDHVSTKYIAAQLYDPFHIGVISVPHALPLDTCKNLLLGSISMRHLFKRAPMVTGGVVQEMDTLYLEKLEARLIPPSFTEVFTPFLAAYTSFYQNIGAVAGFSGKPNSFGFHHYWCGSRGITPHQDYASDVYLIASFILRGSGRLYVCRDRVKTGLSEIPAETGSLILMRAARNENEQRYRPFHGVDAIEGERDSLILRQRV